jgi:tellurite resistance protein
MNLARLPIGFYGAVMGLVGLGLTARVSAPLFPGVIRAPAYFTELWVALGVIAFLILFPLYVLKVFLRPGAVREEFTHPLQVGFCGALPVGMGLLAGGLLPYSPSLAEAVWWTAFALMVAFQGWGLYRLLAGGMALEQLNGGWLILLVGGIVIPGAGAALGHVEAARFVFGVSAAAVPVLVALLFYRAAFAPALPEALRPTWFILLVPPSLVYANGLALYPGMTFLENLFFFGLVLAVALLVYARGFLRWPFAPTWWAFTFPLDALAFAAARYAQDHPEPVWRGVAAACLLLATLFVAIVLVKQVIAFFATPRSAASRPA